MNEQSYTFQNAKQNCTATIRRVNGPMVGPSHRHLNNIDFLMARTACLVCFITTVNGHSKKKIKKAKKVALVAAHNKT